MKCEKFWYLGNNIFLSSLETILSLLNKPSSLSVVLKSLIPRGGWSNNP